MNRPPSISKALWSTLSDVEKSGVVATCENQDLIHEVGDILGVLPREVLLQVFASVFCAMYEFDRAVCIEAAYRTLNVFARAMTPPPDVDG